jgi:hypothetical protein
MVCLHEPSARAHVDALGKFLGMLKDIFNGLEIGCVPSEIEIAVEKVV